MTVALNVPSPSLSLPSQEVNMSSSSALAQPCIHQENSNHHERRNTYSAISHLPAEILAFIFVITKEVIFFEPYDPYGGTDWTWTRLLHVCSRWRQIIMNTPQFWACICPTHFDLSEMVQNSKQAMLCLNLPFYKMDQRQFSVEDINHGSLESVLSQSDRIRELHIRYHDKDHTPVVLEIFKLANHQCFRNLSELNMWYDAYSASPFFEFQWSFVPALRTFTFWNLFISVPPSPVLSLTHLEMIVGALPAAVIHLQWLFDILLQTPNLEILKVEILCYVGAGINVPHSINLPKLKTLSLSSYATDIVGVFEGLCLSASVNISLRLFHSCITQTCYDIPSLLSSCRHQGEFPPGYRIDSPHPTVTIQREITARHMHPDHTFHVVLETIISDSEPLDLQIKYSNLKDSTDGIQQIIAFETVLAFAIHLEHEDISFLIPMLASCRDLRTLTLYACGPDDLQDILRCLADQSSATELETLCLHRSVWSDELGSFILEVSNDFPIRKFVLHNSTITEHQVKTLKALGEIDWDGGISNADTQTQ